MKKMLLMAGVLALAACGEKKAETPAAETTGEMAPAAADTAMAIRPNRHDAQRQHDGPGQRGALSSRHSAFRFGPRHPPGPDRVQASSSPVSNGRRTTTAWRPPATTSSPGAISRRRSASPRVRSSSVSVERTVPTSRPAATMARPSGTMPSPQTMPRSSRLVCPRKWSRATVSCPV